MYCLYFPLPQNKFNKDHSANHFHFTKTFQHPFHSTKVHCTVKKGPWTRSGALFWTTKKGKGRLQKEGLVSSTKKGGTLFFGATWTPPTPPHPKAAELGGHTTIHIRTHTHKHEKNKMNSRVFLTKLCSGLKKQNQNSHRVLEYARIPKITIKHPRGIIGFGSGARLERSFLKTKQKLSIFLYLSLSLVFFLSLPFSFKKSCERKKKLLTSKKSCQQKVVRHQTEYLPPSYFLSQNGSRWSNKMDDKLDDGVLPA